MKKKQEKSLLGRREYGFQTNKDQFASGFHYPLLQFFVPFFTIPCSTFHNLFTIPCSSFHNSLFHLNNSLFRFSQFFVPLFTILCSAFHNYFFHFVTILVPLFAIPCSTYHNSLLHFVAIPCCSLCIFLYPFVLAVPISCLLFPVQFSPPPRPHPHRYLRPVKHHRITLFPSPSF